mmetsp:Transcript_22663/g.68221  ORF Transcript_22663/g.68221 Transcript_22663/m.68221 type:complete len:228 (+) Transcript_22663:73-756(+)
MGRAHRGRGPGDDLLLPRGKVLHHILNHLNAVLVGREDGLGVKLHGGDRQRLVLDSHDDAFGGGCHHVEALGERLLVGKDRVIPRRGELLGHPVHHVRFDVATQPHRVRLAVHRGGEDVELAAVVLHDRLQPEAHSKHRDPAIGQSADHVGRTEVIGAPGAGRHEHHVRLEAHNFLDRQPSPHGRHFGAALPHIVGQRVHERVFVVNQQHAIPASFDRRRPRRAPGH